jgi:cytochrome c peroxidase
LTAFVSKGCAGCHNGPNFGGTTLQEFGLVKDYWLETRSKDRYVFRVPMLRNVAKTAPYFHDGSVEHLDRAVRIMASVQFGRSLDELRADGRNRRCSATVTLSCIRDYRARDSSPEADA